MKNNLKLLLFLFAFYLVQTVFASPIRITDFRFSAQPDKTRVVFDATGPIDYSVQELDKKIIINIKNAKLIGILNKTWLYNTPIDTVHDEQFDKDLHITFNLKRATKSQHFVLNDPYRLVFDFPLAATVVTEKFQWPKDQDESLTLPKKVEVHEKVEAHEDEIVTESQAKNVEQTAEILQGSRDVIVVIDPGHGGRDPGAIGARGTHEKDVALAISQELQKTINKIKGFRAVLTRKGDYFIPLRMRLAIAHRYKADMFIAIHADAYKCTDTSHGASVFALSERGATSEAARWLAEKENESELGHAISNKNALLRSVLIDLAQTATIGASLQIGEVILHYLTGTTHLHSAHVEQAGFVVLKSPDIPSLLVETGFISDPYEEKRLRSASYQRELAVCLASGITRYFLYRPPKGTYLAQVKYKSKN